MRVDSYVLSAVEIICPVTLLQRFLRSYQITHLKVQCCVILCLFTAGWYKNNSNNKSNKTKGLPSQRVCHGSMNRGDNCSLWENNNYTFSLWVSQEHVTSKHRMKIWLKKINIKHENSFMQQHDLDHILSVPPFSVSLSHPSVPPFSVQISLFLHLSASACLCIFPSLLPLTSGVDKARFW